MASKTVRPVRELCAYGVRAVEIRERSEVLMRDIAALMQDSVADFAGGKVPVEDCADLGLLFRETESFLDEARKDCKARKEFAGTIIGGVAARMAQRGDLEKAGSSVYGSICTALPILKVGLSPPKEGTPEYDATIKHFNLPKELIDSGALQFHYVKYNEWVNSLLEVGAPLPPGVSKNAYPIYGASFRRRKVQG